MPLVFPYYEITKRVQKARKETKTKVPAAAQEGAAQLQKMKGVAEMSVTAMVAASRKQVLDKKNALNISVIARIKILNL